MADTPQSNDLSRYLDYLPAIFREPTEAGQPPFLGRFLLAFEEILTGRGQAEAGIEEILDGIPGRLAGVQRYFEPGPGGAVPDGQRAPRAFLEWLSGWVALALRADIDEPQQRQLIARAASLYRLRGTREGLAAMLSIYALPNPDIEEFATAFQIGVSSTIGKDTQLDGGPAHFFRVTIRLPNPDLNEFARQREIATAIIDMEKPAHTYYELRVETPALQIGVQSTVGVDTLLGPAHS
jgi:phage tail-like protein